jgi:hypothetical protein
MKVRKPRLSPDFTNEDIRKLRRYLDELEKTMTPEEIEAYYRKGVEDFLNYKPKLSKEAKKYFGVKNYDEYAAKYGLTNNVTIYGAS